MTPANQIINDPTMTPLGVGNDDVFIVGGTDDTTFIIARTTLANYGPNAQFYRRVRNWLRLPKYYVRGK